MRLWSRRRRPIVGQQLTAAIWPSAVASVLIVSGLERGELPAHYRTDVGYLADTRTAQVEFARGFQGTSFRTADKYRLRVIELRGGTSYTREKWNPTGGVGLNVSRRLALDVAADGTTANAERERGTAVALSLRINP